MMNRTLVLGLAAAGMVSATATVTSMFFYDTDSQSLAASIMGNDATATTYSVNCPPGTDSDECGMGPGMTVIAGPQTTMIMDVPDEDFYYTCICSLDGTTYAVCSETAAGSGANFPGTTITTLDGDLGLMPVTITAGSVTSVAATAGATTEVQSASKTGSSGSSSTETRSETAAGSAGISSASAAASTGASTSSNASKANASATSTGGGSLITGDAALLFGGAAAAALVAAVL
ncbi:putative GPI anchored protein [Aspergillus ibericus CBS 121593]|uniref:GPI anchored protein n=1 Tax=Aspergillus ibericus CBS 121593 TaxID=1448316 RepID=A0A395GPQ1_9EURO|nr:hypothetical protein BO80DRAFT_216845 [Aspergillus ibericus CBS 121593]RAK96827.1 hypothetical protein BO80DRAFT_216845 [Aspergillus ibericus CBS 121593]